MRLPTIRGTIRRRLLVNFRVDPDVMQALLPFPFRPKLQNGQAIAGICLIRLEDLRPLFLPRIAGFSSENAAHRIAVVWDEKGARRDGVYIPRRDTDSLLNHLGGGRIFPGEHHRARFEVVDTGEDVDVRMESADHAVVVRVSGRPASQLSTASTFSNLDEASRFFESGSTGYSATATGKRLDGLVLKTHQWKVEPLDVREVYSSFFADPANFPAGSVAFDCALIMRDIAHEWHAASDLYVDGKPPS